MRTVFLIATSFSAILTTFAVPVGNVPITKQAGQVVPHSYIVKLKHTVSRDSHIANLLSNTSNAKVKHKYRHVLHGYAVELKGKDLDYVRQSSDVEEIFEEGILKVKYDASEIPREAKPAAEHVKRHPPPQVHPAPLEPVTIFILSTGVYRSHSCFHRIERISTFLPVEDYTDNMGYGTHAACIAATISRAKIFSIKCWNGMEDPPIGRLSAALDIVFDRGNPERSIVLIPFPVFRTQDEILTTAFSKLEEAEYHIVMAAGERGRDDSEEFYPILATKVGAVNSENERIADASYGEYITVWALGVRTSAVAQSYQGYYELTGSGPASAYVAGLLAARISTGRPMEPGVLIDLLRRRARHLGRRMPDGTTDLVVNLAANDW